MNTQFYDRVNVQDFGALGDGLHDDAPAIQAALDSLAKQGGVVYLPAGLYRMASGVTVPMGVNVEGITTATTGPWQNYLDTQDKHIPLEDGLALNAVGEAWIDPRLFKGTWVLSDHGKGEPNGAPTFRMMGNTSIRRVGFVNKYLPPVTEEITPCPPCIAHISTNANPYCREGVTVEDISLANCYYGIVISTGDDLDSNYPELNGPYDLSQSCGRHRIHNIMGGPIYRGILLKNLLDTVDIHNCQFNMSCYIPQYWQARRNNCVDIYLCRGDGMSISNVLSYGAYYGIKTEASFKNNMGTCSMRVNNCNFESVTPMVLHSAGLYQIANCYFLGINPERPAGENEVKCLQIIQPEHCVHNPFITFTNCVFQLNFDTKAAFIDVQLTAGCNPVISSSQFWGWCDSKPLINMTKSDSAPGSLTLTDCVFTGNKGAFHLPSEMAGTLAKVDGDGYHDGELRFVNCRFPETLLDNASRQRVWYEGCVAYDDEGSNHRIQIGQ